MLGIPVPIWIVFIVSIILMLVLKFTTLGRNFFALGANPHAARASGLTVKKTLLWAFVFSGLLAATGGIILAARLNAVDQDLGVAYLLPAIASPVMGGTSMTGGQGGIGGTIIGSFNYDRCFKWDESGRYFFSMAAICNRNCGYFSSMV